MTKLRQALFALLHPLFALFAGARLFVDPSRLDQVFALERALYTRRVQRDLVARLCKDARTAPLVSARRPARLPPLATLRSHQRGTLGHAFVDYCDAHHLDPASIPERAVFDDGSFVVGHLYATHDLWHVVTGFAPDVAGEVGLQAFYYAQLPSPLAWWIVVGGIANALLLRRDDVVGRLSAVSRGWTLGKRCAPLFGLDWAARLGEPLDDVRAALGLLVKEAITVGPYAPTDDSTSEGVKTAWPGGQARPRSPAPVRG
jgi:ubiquinone biosynthesis protein COQ4